MQGENAGTERVEKWRLLLVGMAGLMGASGVAAGAAAAHSGGGGALETASNYLLFHAATVIALTVNRHADRVLQGVASLMAVGCLVFSGDLASRVLAGIRLAPMAAPAGGLMLIAGWGFLGLTGMVRLTLHSTGR